MKYRKKPVVVEAYQTDREVIIHTLEGDMKASVGDYIITGVNGEQYPCKPDIFKKTYELVKKTRSKSDDSISRKAAINALERGKDKSAKGDIAGFYNKIIQNDIDTLKRLPPAQPETCEGCKHLGKWENEVEYGYSSPCTCCKRRVEDNYEKSNNSR